MSGGKLGALAHNPKALAAGAGLVVVVALMSKKSAGSADASGTSDAAAPGQITPNQGGYYDSTANDVYNSLAGQLQSLQQQIQDVSSGASTPTPTPNVPPVTTTPTPAPKVGGPISPSPTYVSRTWAPTRTPAPTYTR